MKILLYNIAYGTGLNGSWQQYFYKIWRFLWLSPSSTQNITQLLEKQRADVFCLIEVDGGSLRNRFSCQAQKIADKLDCDFYQNKLKYHPKSLWRFAFFFRKQQDAIISRIQGKFRRHYLKSGMKKLVQEYIVNNISIFAVHLAVMSKKIRQKQLEELSDILKICPRPIILCGDFNIRGGLEEVDIFLKKTGLKLVELPATWPSCNPKKHFDLFFASPDIKIRDAGVIQSEYSDHLPAWLEIDL
jgi:endonuclease/exonuclease/phosphatase family metal-dependent hydrolase